MINIQKYVRAQSLEEAYTLNQKKKNRILAGMLWTRMESGNVPVAIDLCDLGLDKIEENEEEFSIGAMVTLRQLQKHESFENYCDGIVAGCSMTEICWYGSSLKRNQEYSVIRQCVRRRQISRFLPVEYHV